MQTSYSFITRWEIEASLPSTWDAIYNSMAWPSWWKGVLSVVELKKGDHLGIGGEKRYTWKSVLPYKLEFSMRLTENEPLKRLKGVAFGELEGEGEWTFAEKNGIIQIQYNWNVYTTKAWMNHLSFLLKPAFSLNHNVVMHWGATGLAEKLQARLVKG